MNAKFSPQSGLQPHKKAFQVDTVGHPLEVGKRSSFSMLGLLRRIWLLLVPQDPATIFKTGNLGHNFLICILEKIPPSQAPGYKELPIRGVMSTVGGQWKYRYKSRESLTTFITFKK